MQLHHDPRTAARRAGFTLAEVAVTILIVGVTLVFLLQGLSTARWSAQHTKDMSIANQLALYTMGQIEAGLYQEDELDSFQGDYAEEDYAEFVFDIRIGEETFPSPSGEYDDGGGRFDSFAYREEQRQDELDEEDREEEDLPYEKVRIRVTFPKYGEYVNELILERWIPWEQVYGPDEDAEEEQAN